MISQTPAEIQTEKVKKEGKVDDKEKYSIVSSIVHQYDTDISRVSITLSFVEVMQNF